MCNIGVHPTINKLSKTVIEVNLFDFNQMVYDEVITLSFIKFLRNEEKYPTLEILVDQIKQDKVNCLKLIKEIEGK